jgi:hypothetical protein
MAFRNSVKATLLEMEQPRLRSTEHDAIFFEAPAPAPIIEPAPVITPPPVVVRASLDDALSAATWHARAEALRDLADTLPSKTTRPLIPKIAALYDQVACNAGWSEPDALAPDDLGLEDEPPVVAPHADPVAVPRPAERSAFPRRRMLAPGRQGFARRPV